MDRIIYITEEEPLRRLIREELEKLVKPPPLLPPPKDDRVGFEEIKELTGLSVSQLYKLTMNNAIPHRKFAKQLVFSIEEVTSWMEQHTTSKETSKQKAARQLQKLAMKRVKK